MFIDPFDRGDRYRLPRQVSVEEEAWLAKNKPELYARLHMERKEVKRLSAEQLGRCFDPIINLFGRAVKKISSLFKQKISSLSRRR